MLKKLFKNFLIQRELTIVENKEGSDHFYSFFVYARKP